MKSFYYSLIIFISILISSILSDIYVKKQILFYKSNLIAIENVDNETSKTRIKIAKEKFTKQKNMLQLFINKEHISDFEKNILLIEHYCQNDDIENNKEIIIETIHLINQIDENIIF